MHNFNILLLIKVVLVFVLILESSLEMIKNSENGNIGEGGLKQIKKENFKLVIQRSIIKA